MVTCTTPPFRAAVRLNSGVIFKEDFMRNLLALVLLTAFPYSGFAATTTCIVEGSSTTVKAVAWDDETNVAKVTDHLGNTREGRVTLESDHNHWKKVNIFVDYESTYYGVDAAEYIVFSTLPGTYRDRKSTRLNSSHVKI